MNMTNDRLIAPSVREREQQGAATAAESLIKKDRARDASQGGDTLDEIKARKASEHGADAKPERSKERSAGMGW